MSVSIKGIVNDKITFWGFFWSFLLLSISIIYTILSFSHLPPFIPLYNKLPWGVGRLGTKIEIFIPLGLTLEFFICNLILSAFVYAKVPLLARILAFVMFFVSLFTCIFIFKIITLIA